MSAHRRDDGGAAVASFRQQRLELLGVSARGAMRHAGGKLTNENKDSYKCENVVDRMLQVGGEVWAVVNNENEIIGWHYGTYRGYNSMFFKVKHCDFEHVELMVDERYRRNGIALHLLYHTVKNLNFNDVKNKKLGTCIRPDNIPSMRLHENIGFKKSHRVIFLHQRKNKDGNYSFINIPHYSI